MLKRLNETIEPQISPRQYGFRKRRSTEDAIIKLRDITKESEKKYVLAIFLDIKGAFDNVWWPGVLRELRRKRCPGDLYLLIKDYLNGRKVLIREGTKQIEKNVNKGCPQGSVLGPILWNLVIDIILWELTTLGCQTIAYADDQVVFVEANSKRELEMLGQKYIDWVQRWCRQQKLSLSPSKCAMLFLKGKLNARAPPKIKIGEKSIKRMETVKYLGVSFSTGMKIGAHVDAIANKTKAIFNSLGRLARRHWGLGYKTLEVIYKGLYVPIATYGAAGWIDLMNSSHKRKLEMSQRHALLKITGAYRTVSAHALSIITGNMPITLECERKADLYRIRKDITCRIGEFEFAGETDLSAELTEEEKEEARSNARLKSNQFRTKQWQTQWETSSKGRTTFQYMPNVAQRTEQKWLKPSRWTTQFLTGHGDFKSYLNRFKITETNECSCGEMDTPEHVLKDCSKYNTQREKLKRETGMHAKIVESDLLNENNHKAFEQFAKDVLTIKEVAEALEEQLVAEEVR